MILTYSTVLDLAWHANIPLWSCGNRYKDLPLIVADPSTLEPLSCRTEQLKTVKNTRSGKSRFMKHEQNCSLLRYNSVPWNLYHGNSDFLCDKKLFIIVKKWVMQNSKRAHIVTLNTTANKYSRLKNNTTTYSFIISINNLVYC